VTDGPDPVAPTARIVAELNRLRNAAGGLTTRQIAERTGNAVSHTTVAETLNGNRIPGWRAMRAIVLALGGDEELFMALWIGVKPPPEREPGDSPSGAASLAALPDRLRGLARDVALAAQVLDLTDRAEVEADRDAARRELADERQQWADARADLNRHIEALYQQAKRYLDAMARVVYGRPYDELPAGQQMVLEYLFSAVPPAERRDDGATIVSGPFAAVSTGGGYTLYAGDRPLFRFTSRDRAALVAVACAALGDPSTTDS
jgi:transcriptional regulator with XRE-family HTH domain